jgi:quinol monooxygenase YgiN
MVTVVARYLVSEGHESTVARLLRNNAEASRGEPGCLEFSVYQEIDDPRAFLLYERCSERAAQQSNTDQHTSLRNLWSSSTSSRISLGSCARCHWHSRRPVCSCSPSGAAARAALIA